MFLRSSFSRGLLASLALFASGVVATAAPEFSIPDKQIDFQGAKFLKTTKRVYLPGVNLEVLNWGKITSVTQTSALQSLSGASNSTARSTMEVAVPSDIAALRAIAGELHADLATKLTASGWEVVPAEEAKANATLAASKLEEVDDKLGAPIRKVTLGKQKMNYTIASPEGMPVYDYGILMPFWGLRSGLKDLKAHGLAMTYRFDTIALEGKSRRGIGSNTASTNAEANLLLVHAQGSFLNGMGGGGYVRLKNPLAVVGGIGEIKKASDVSPEIANGLSKALSFLGGGSINSKKGLYVCELNQAELKASVLLAGKTFNDELVKAFGPVP